MIELENAAYWNQLPSNIRKDIITNLNRTELDPAEKSLCGACSALGLRDYILFAALIELTLIQKMSPISIYEGVLQCYLFLGFPRAIEGLKKLNTVFSSTGVKIDLPLRIPDRDFIVDGFDLCQRIYGHKYSKLI